MLTIFLSTLFSCLLWVGFSFGKLLTFQAIVLVTVFSFSVCFFVFYKTSEFNGFFTVSTFVIFVFVNFVMWVTYYVLTYYPNFLSVLDTHIFR